MNNNEYGASLAKETLTGDLRDKLLENMRNLPDVWQKLNEKAQQDQIDRATAQAKDLVEQAVKLIASGGRKTVPAKLEKLTLKDGCKVEMTCSSSWIGELAPVLNNDVLIVTNSDDEFRGEKAPAKPEPDQADMFNQEYQEADGEGIPDSEKPAPETPEEAPINMENLSELPALPAPDNYPDENPIVNNMIDVDFEEVGKPGTDSMPDKTENKDYLEELLAPEKSFDEAEQVFFEGQENAESAV